MTVNSLVKKASIENCICGVEDNFSDVISIGEAKFLFKWA